MENNRKKSHRQHTPEFRMEVVRLHEEEKKSYNYIAHHYNISRNTIKNWVGKQRAGKDLSVDKRSQNSGRRKRKVTYKERYEILKKMQEFLKEQREKKPSL